MKTRNFTLVELLTVIAVIAILAGILLPVINGSLKKADQTKAKAEITTLVNAIEQFRSTYGYLPKPSSYTEGNVLSTNEYEDLIRMLQADEDFINNTTNHGSYGSGKNPNKKKIRFLDIQGNNPGEYKDPWDGDYKVVFDAGNDGNINATVDVIDASKIYKSVIVWSEGMKTGTGTEKKDNIYSLPVEWNKTTEKFDITK